MARQQASGPGRSSAPPARNVQDRGGLRYVYWYALAAGCAVAALLAVLEGYQHHASGAGLIVAPLVISIISFAIARRSLRKTAATASAAELHTGRLLTRMIIVWFAAAVLVMLTVAFHVGYDLVWLFFGN